MCDYLAGLQPDTGPMHDPWEHIGRLWTNGDPFLAVDAALRSAWRGTGSKFAGIPGPTRTTASLGGFLRQHRPTTDSTGASFT
jgi:hypothetical protein